MTADRRRHVIARQIALAAIRGYQAWISPLLWSQCRFHPSCSEYAAEAFQRHPPGRALGMTLRRLSRCRPCGGHGYDPVDAPPEARRPPST